MAGAVSIAASGNANIDGLLQGFKWNSSALSYNFPTSAAYYPSDYFETSSTTWNIAATFSPATASLIATIVVDLQENYASATPLTFTPVASNVAADASYGMADLPSFGGYGFGPSSAQRGGDAWFDSLQARFNNIVMGDGAWRLLLHEIGHTMGLKHGHEFGGVSGVTLPVDRDSNEFTVMTYRKYVGADPAGDSGADVEQYGFAQSLMMLDIAALQYMYGANFNTNSDDTVYTFDPFTGQMFVDGAGQGAPGVNRIFRTIWDGNGIDTYDLSNYSTGVQIDLGPGGWSVFSSAQLAKLSLANSIFARGNVFNALQYQGDERSLIENAVGGSGADTIVGNTAANMLTGNSGGDSLDGASGNDILIGGPGTDTLLGGDGNDTIYGELSDLSIQGGAGNDLLYLPANSAFRGYAMGANSIEQMITGENGNQVNVVSNADGSIDEATYDTANTQTYGFYANHYTSNWTLYLQQFIDDNGNLRNLGYDINNTEPFTYYQNTYNSSNQLLTQQILDDNGNQRVVGFDVANTQPFTSYVNTYNPGGQLILQQILDDNGNNRVIGYDVDDLHPWTYYQNTYNPAGELIDQLLV